MFDNQPKPTEISNSPIAWVQTLAKGGITFMLALVVVVLTYFIFSSQSSYVFEQNGSKQQNTYFLGEIVKINDAESDNQVDSTIKLSKQEAQVVALEGAKKGQEFTVQTFAFENAQKLQVHDRVVLYEQINPSGQLEILFADTYRLDRLTFVVLIMVVVVILLSGFRGLSSILSLVFSIEVLIYFFLPQVIQELSIFWATLSTSLLVLLVSIYLSHGFNKRSTVSIFSIMLTLIVATLFSSWMTHFLGLSGLANEDSSMLMLVATQNNLHFDIQGLLLAGMVIGTIGILDDVASTQAAAVEELSLANPLLGKMELFWRAMNIGREHISSMINTLALVYAGGALPLLLLLILNSGSPAWVILNNEILVEEIARTVGGSLGLLLAVPITTMSAAVFLRTKPKSS